MRIVLPALLVFAGLTTSQSNAQNLVRNGDFASSTIAPWTASGYAANPGLTKYDTNSTGISQCYNCEPGGKSNTPPFPPHVLSQPGVILVPLMHELSFDIAANIRAISITPAMPQVEVFAGTQKLLTFKFGIARQNPRRQRVCARFTPVQSGPQTLRVEFSYPSMARPGISPRIWIDNVSVRRASNPTFCIPGPRKLGTAIEFAVEGTPSAAFVVFMAFKLGPQPIAIPGIRGAYALDLVSTIPMLTGALDAKGLFMKKVTIPKIAGLGGLPLYWQGLEAGSSGVSLGLESLHAFYD